MMNSLCAVESLSSSDLLSATRELAQKSCDVEAELIVHLGEIDERKLYLDCAFSSMFASARIGRPACSRSGDSVRVSGGLSAPARDALR